MSKPDYKIDTSIRFGPLEHIDVKGLASSVGDTWHNQTLCQVNDCVVRLGVIDGDFHWHSHEKEDEFFYVVEGHLFIDVKNRDTVELKPGEGFMVPRRVEHRPRTKGRTVILMFEADTVVPTGD